MRLPEFDEEQLKLARFNRSFPAVPGMRLKAEKIEEAARSGVDGFECGGRPAKTTMALSDATRARDPAVRVAYLQGEGDTFTAGSEIAGFPR